VHVEQRRSYVAEVSRDNPTCVLLLVDQSRSILGPVGGRRDRRRSEALAELVNNFLYRLVMTCVRQSNVLDRLHVAVLGYGRQGRSVLGGALAGRDLVPISELAHNPLRVENHSLTDEADTPCTLRVPVWVDPVVHADASPATALERACTLLRGFLDDHPDCFPPLVFNVSGDDAVGDDAEQAAVWLRRFGSSDGQALLFNFCLSTTAETPVCFPEREGELPAGPARRLFRMSSPMEQAWRCFRRRGDRPTEQARAFALAGDADSFGQALAIIEEALLL
jgi:hypothetical protein